MILFPAAFQTALETDGAALTHVLTIEMREGVTHRFVLSGDNLLIAPDTYLKDVWASMSSISNDVEAGARCDIGLATNTLGPIVPADVSGGRYKSAIITIDSLDRDNAAATQVTIFKGRVSNVNDSDSGLVTLEAKGFSSFSSDYGARTIGTRCPYLFGDPVECQVPVRPADVLRGQLYNLNDRVRIDQSGYQNRSFVCTTAGVTAGSAPSYDYVVGNTTTDGGAVFTAEESYTRQGTVNVATNPSNFTITVTEVRKTDFWFTHGAIRMTSGANAGLSRQIRLYTSADDRVELWQAFPATVANGDAFEVHPGCDHTFAGGCTTFANTKRYGGINFNIKDLIALQ